MSSHVRHRFLLAALLVAAMCCRHVAAAPRSLFQSREPRPQQPLATSALPQQQQQQPIPVPNNVGAAGSSDAFAFGNYDEAGIGGGGQTTRQTGVLVDEPLRLNNIHKHIIKHIVTSHAKVRERNPDLYYIAAFFALACAPVCFYFIRAYHDLHRQAVTRIARVKETAGDRLRMEARAREFGESGDNRKDERLQRGKGAREDELRMEFERREREMREEFARDKERIVRDHRAREAELKGQNKILSRAVETSEHIIAAKSDEIARAKRG